MLGYILRLGWTKGGHLRKAEGPCRPPPIIIIRLLLLVLGYILRLGWTKGGHLRKAEGPCRPPPIIIIRLLLAPALAPNREPDLVIMMLVMMFVIYEGCHFTNNKNK